VGLSAVVVALALLLALGSVGGTAAIMAALGTSTWRLSPLLAMALTATCLIGVALRLRRTIAKPGRDAIGAQAPREFLPAVRAQGHALLDAREQEALVWGIEHFVSEEPTPHLDLPATVRDTAREGGVPRPRFKLARATREVWLWVDESAQDAAAGRLAGEIEAALRAHGLPVERAAFWGLPDPLYPPAGRPFGPNEEEERRDGALVAVLTDGRLLRIQHAVDSARVGIDALLRELARWPRLAFVDFSPGGELRRVLAHHGLDVIAPRRLAVYLGASEAARLAVRPARRAEVDARRREADTWAAACCLAPAGSVDEGAALALARELRVSAWALPLLRAAAPGPPGRLAWTHVQRVRWLDAFAHADVYPAASVAPGSRLDVALRFWERRYDDELGRRQGDAAAAAADEQREDPRHPPPSMRLRIEREALRLWRDPHRAARALHVLYGEALREPIRAYLGRLTPADGAREGCVRLPWDWGHIAAAEQAMLAEMGFASGHAAVRLRAAGRIWLALGVSLSVAAAAVLAPPSAVAVVAVLGALSLSRPWQRRAWARLRSVFAPPAPPAPVDEAVEPPPSRRPLPPGIASLATYRFSVVTVDERGVERERREAEARYFAEDLGAGVALEMTLVPGGTFVMGSPADEAKRGSAEGPQHRVTLGPFFFGRYPVTQAQWRAVARLRKIERDLDPEPSHFKGDTRPVEQVTWHNAVEFCRRLSRHTGRDYRLPSEAQWEYACRAGTTTPFHFGPTITPELVNYDGKYPYGAAAKGKYRKQTTPVGELGVANAFGLFDMHGNVWEWCQDIAHNDYNGAPVDGSPWETGGDAARRVLRGGARNNDAGNCRSAVRGRSGPENRVHYVGFRVVCAVSRTQ
jgi:formylglycine-generating enzyme required for sulfatase activity